MKDYKKSGKYSWIIMLGIVVGICAGVFWTFKPVHVDQKAIQDIFDQDIHYLYFYDQLTSSQQETYRRLLYAFVTKQDDIFLEETDLEVVQEVMTFVTYDHPEFYYVNNQFEYREEHHGITFLPKYDYTIEDINLFQQKIDEKTETIISNAKQYKTKSEQARYVYDYLIQNIEYKENKKTDQNILSSLLEGKSVCAGYARAYQYLLAKLDIESAYIVGEAIEDNSQTLRGDGHAWVMVKINNDYYYCDPTWGDVVQEGMEHTCYGYFMMTSSEMKKCYKPEVLSKETKGKEHFYFDETHTYLDKYDQKIMSQAIQVGLENKSRVAEIKCANKEIYKRVKNEIENSYLGYHLLNQNDCWSNDATYACFDDLKIIELYY